jgi:hypothetical protein
MAIKFKRTSEIKFYLYISKAKLQMLFQQIGRADGSKRSVEWKAAALVGSLTRKTESAEDPIDDDDKLLAVIQELEGAGQVGTIYEPNVYVKGIMPMRWGLYDDGGTRPNGEPALVYFGGLDKENGALLGLGGSSKHVVGHEGATSTHSRSVTPALVKALLRGLEFPIAEIADMPEWWDKRAEEDEVYQAIALAQHYLRPPTQNLEFFAKTLMVGETHRSEQYIDIPKATVILGTPLYVALSAPVPDGNHWGIIPD